MPVTQELEILYDISQTLNKYTDLKKSLYEVMAILAEKKGMVRGTVTILNKSKREIEIEVAHGLSKTAMEKGKYYLGEGITGSVIESGEPIAIPKISQEQKFLNRTQARQNESEVSFFCVPVKNQEIVIGALSIDKHYSPDYNLDEGIFFLSVVAAMIARQVINLERVRSEKEKLKLENLRLQGELEDKYSFSQIIGNSNKMREVYKMISQVSGSNATVLIRGESGTGKELVANSIHYNSPRAEKPFIKINCSALPPNLIESELFGHEKGSFTGAINQKKGKFELADKGTIFLDEMGSVDPSVQVRLLRVLQEKSFERVGGTKTVNIDVRVIAATNKNLEDAVEKGEFRGDLYYRLNVFPIFLPPLRDRKTDILLLADHFLVKYSKENNKEIKRLSTPAIDMLMAYHWPGNVRELENCIERAVLLSEEGVIHTYHLPPTIQMGDSTDTLPSASLEEAVETLEREMIIDSLKNSKGNVTKAADILKTTVRKFSYKAKLYGVNYKDYR
ncbi:MAG: sigma 54-interacting transcriptional regulator [Desulfobacteraceae bacterium]|nr:sigma 54-interacting transcriptional regulator [Desulfobacteraceae bacterium]MCB9494989.1 sigma 54-interacting transcriptional regulator [Desulfobacteraceae bacterium]